MNERLTLQESPAPDIALALDVLSAEWGEGARAIAESLARGAAEREHIHDWVDRAYLQFLHGLTKRHLASDKTGPATREHLTKLHDQLARQLAALGDPPAEMHNAAADAEAVSFTHQVTSLLWAANQPQTEAVKRPLPRADRDSAPTAADLTPAFDSIRVAIQQVSNRAHDAATQIEAVRIALEQTRPNWDVHEMKELLLDGARELFTVHTELARKLEQIGIRASEKVSTAEVLASSAPDITNRDALLKSLSRETERARRYGQNLAVAIIRPASPPGMNPFVGTGAARQVLRTYSEQVFTRLRVSDVVGEHDKASFAVVLPQTDSKGALTALRKIQTHVAGAHFVYAGRRRPVPWFHGGVTSYASGESPATVLARAERALRTARNFDSHRIELETPPGAPQR